MRLQQGRMESATVYSEDPVAMAKHWLAQGARRLHIVDLNGAIAGRPKNEKVIRDMIKALGGALPIELGGGIRDLDTIESYIDAGVTYVVIGTAAVKNPGFLSDACYAFPGRIIAGLDAKDGKVAVEGWSKMTGHDVADLAKKFEEYGVEALIYTTSARRHDERREHRGDAEAREVHQDADHRLGRAQQHKDVREICEKLVPRGSSGPSPAARSQGKLDLKKAQRPPIRPRQCTRYA